MANNQQEKIKFDQYLRPIITENIAFEILYQDQGLPTESIIDLDTRFMQFYEQFYYSQDDFEYKKLDASIEEYHNKQASNISIPTTYRSLDIFQYLKDKCKTEIELERVNFEYALYEERGLLDLLKFMIYLVDHMRDENLIWGLGRGSSVSSYILFLIGIHKVDSIKYELDIEEFLKD